MREARDRDRAWPVAQGNELGWRFLGEPKKIGDISMIKDKEAPKNKK